MRSLWARATQITVAVLGPAVLTVVLLPLNVTNARDFVFLYLGLVAVVGVTFGRTSALLGAGASFLLVDYFFVPPIHTFTVSDETDLVNLVVFFGAAGLVGSLGSRRLAIQQRAESMAEALRHANIALEVLNREQAEAAAVAVRLAQTQQQVRSLEETDRLRRELLANVSHELRTPLGSILTGTTALLARPALEPELRARLENLEHEERRLSRLVGDMLDMARIEGHALELRLDDVDLIDAAAAAASRLTAQDPQRAVSVTSEVDDVEVVADWDRLGQILDNLLANADRHAPVNTPIRVVVAAGRRGMAVVHVIDGGPGVPAELREQIFERFVTDTSTVADGAPTGGIGLGLAIVRGLVEAQAGRVWLEDDGGGHFAFCLPLAEPRPESADGRKNVHVDIGERVDEGAQGA